MSTNGNGRDGKNNLEGPYNAGKALGLTVRHDTSLVVLLGVDLAFRVMAQVFMDSGYHDAVLLVDKVIHAFTRGYQDGQREGKES